MSERPTAVAGLFYPEDPAILSAEVERYLTDADDFADADFKALIVPHAGYRYSGAVAGAVYRNLRRRSSVINRVLLLGPSHRVPLHGMAIPSVTGFSSPLGDIALDADALKKLSRLPDVSVDDRAHALEHSLEVQLPFLQRTLKSFSLIPVVVGQSDSEAVARVINLMWGGDETLIVVSSDLSHYHSWREAQVLDRRTADLVLAMEPVLGGDDACGCHAINGLLTVARERGMTAELRMLANSGDTAGSLDRVVGYGAFGFH